MAVTSFWYANAKDQAFSGNINYPSDTMNMALLTSSYTPNLATHVHLSDVNANEISGTGYTAGGVTLASKTHVVTAANSWAAAWAASTAYTVGQVIRPSTGNGNLYICVAAGTSGGTTPTFPTTNGDTVADNTAKWACLGESITVWSSANAQWTTATWSPGAAYGVIYKSTGTASTSPLMGLLNFGTTLSPSAGTVTVQPDATLGWLIDSPS